MTAPAPIDFSIVIDNKDAEECPDLPLTLNTTSTVNSSTTE